jgi:hypothetical protein
MTEMCLVLDESLERPENFRKTRDETKRKDEGRKV